MAVLETERLILRPLTREDVDALAALYADPDVMRFFGFRCLISIIDPGNMASIRVAEKNGMRYKRDIEFEGHMCRMYAVQKDETRQEERIMQSERGLQESTRK